MSEAMMWLLLRGVWETLAMTFLSGFFGFVLGLPVGVLLYVTRPGQIVANAKLYRTLSALVTSHCSAMPPISPATRRALSRLTSSTATLAPRRASSRAVASPRPEPPPVTSAACPWMFMISFLLNRGLD